MTTQVQETVHQQALQVSLSGFDLVNSPRLNKGTAFSDEERDVFDLHGLLPPHVGTLDEQLGRRMQALEAQPTPFAKYSFLRDLQDTNETLFYALVVRKRLAGSVRWDLYLSGRCRGAVYGPRARGSAERRL